MAFYLSRSIYPAVKTAGFLNKARFEKDIFPVIIPLSLPVVL